MAARPEEPRREISWSGWGDPAGGAPLPEGLVAMVRGALGVTRPGRAAPTLADLPLAPVRLPEAVVSRLAEIVGPEHARADHDSRARHARGKSTIDLLELRTGEVLSAPDVVLTPSSHEEVQAVLECCSAARVAVIPFGGGTSVVGGLRPDAAGFAGTATLDTRRLNALVSVDEMSRLAVLEPGLRGPEAEALLGARGWTLGHFPQSWEYATLGGFAAARSSGQSSAGYGRFDERVLALRVATPAGALELGRAPKSAAGPDLRQLILGSEGILGVITSLTLALDPAPEHRVYEGWLLQSFAHGAEVVRRLAQDGPRPTVLRLSDEAETAMGLARPSEMGESGGEDPEGEDSGGGQPGGCLAIVGWEGPYEEVERRRRATAELLLSAGAEPVPGAGEAWAAGRYQGPYLRDALLDSGALVETLETVTFWAALPGLYTAVATALRDTLSALGTPPAVLCHISHVYPAGASLYFTVACAQLDDPIAQWEAAKAAAGEAILAAGGSITHHHGVGADHRALYPREVGALGVEVLRAVKRTLDPAGILNPGILIEPQGGDAFAAADGE
ncbi:MAG TPA: FAD-binding oxidoreductase [Solirubrobacteraceae bacterium]|nr:FAD-binding oxidoreductase [Solirubrobacteraceae bacterium]